MAGRRTVYHWKVADSTPLGSSTWRRCITKIQRAKRLSLLKRTRLWRSLPGVALPPGAMERRPECLGSITAKQGVGAPGGLPEVPEDRLRHGIHLVVMRPVWKGQTFKPEVRQPMRL